MVKLKSKYNTRAESKKVNVVVDVDASNCLLAKKDLFSASRSSVSGLQVPIRIIGNSILGITQENHQNSAISARCRENLLSFRLGEDGTRS